MKKYILEFTESEINHISSLISRNIEEGTYTNPKKQYWDRSDRINWKLEDAINGIKLTRRKK